MRIKKQIEKRLKEHYLSDYIDKYIREAQMNYIKIKLNLDLNNEDKI